MSNIQIKDGNGDIKYLKMTGIGTDGDPYVPEQDVYVKDTSHLLTSMTFRSSLATTTLSLDTIVNNKTVEVTSSAGMSIGNIFTIYSRTTVGSYVGTITNIVAETITLDTPIDVVYEATQAVVTVGSDNMNVDGSGVSQTFSIRPDLPAECVCEVHITKLCLIIETTDPPIFSEFGDIPSGLTNGIVIRKTDGVYNNLFNVKSNSDLALFGTEFQILTAALPFGINGINAKNAFGGTDNFGSIIKLGAAEDLELIVQDNLSTLIKIKMIAQGHIVDA